MVLQTLELSKNNLDEKESSILMWNELCSEKQNLLSLLKMFQTGDNK